MAQLLHIYYLMEKCCLHVAEGGFAMKTTMTHILHVVLQNCGGYEADIDLGHFLAHQLQEALDCAKSHINPSDATIIRMVPLGPYDNTQVRVVWYHDPKECMCAVCVTGRADPLFRHDCSECEFLGCTVAEGGRNCDLYYCPTHDEYIGRFSSTPPDYIARKSDMIADHPTSPTFTARDRHDLRKAQRVVEEAQAAE